MFPNNLLFAMDLTCNFSPNRKIECRIRIFFIEHNIFYQRKKVFEAATSGM